MSPMLFHVYNHRRAGLAKSTEELLKMLNLHPRNNGRTCIAHSIRTDLPALMVSQPTTSSLGLSSEELKRRHIDHFNPSSTPVYLGAMQFLTKSKWYSCDVLLGDPPSARDADSEMYGVDVQRRIKTQRCYRLIIRS